MTSEDLDSPVPGADECQRCGLESFGCICDPRRPYRQPTPADIEAARQQRLVRAELRAVLAGVWGPYQEAAVREATARGEFE